MPVDSNAVIGGHFVEKLIIRTMSGKNTKIINKK